SNNLYFHNRLEQDRIRSANAVLKRHHAGNLKRDFRAVYIMVASIKCRNLDVHNRKPCKHAILRSLFYALADSGDVLLWNNASLDCLIEFNTRAAVLRFQAKPYVSVLSAASALLDIL